MAQTQRHVERLGELDNLLRTDENSELFSTPDESGFYGWYSRLLSTLTVLTDGEELQYGEARFDDGKAEFVLYTSTNAITARVSDTADDHAHPVANAVPRRRIHSLSASASMRHDLRGSHLTAWPGTLTIEATYEGLDQPIVAVGNAYDRSTVDHIGSISKLLKYLRDDLAIR